MSAGLAIPHRVALRVAESVVDYLGQGCAQIAIAGSLRRATPEVHDIEIVAEPRIVMRAGDELFPVEHETDLLEERVTEAINRGTFELRQVETRRRTGSGLLDEPRVEYLTKNGPAYKALVVAGLPLDLFVVRPPATWGVIFALRTGPGDWNTRLVTECKAIGRRVHEGQVERWLGATSTWEQLPTPTEESFFAALGQRWLEPRDRSVDAVAIRRPDPVGAH